jgi:hypothetical protein
MQYRAPFRLALKAIGVLLICQGGPDVIERVAGYVTWYMLDAAVPATSMHWARIALHIAGPAIQTILGIYLLLGGEWVVRLVLPTATPHCGECGYDLTGLLGEQCPECGAAIHQDAEPKRETLKKE